MNPFPPGYFLDLLAEEAESWSVRPYGFQWYVHTQRRFITMTPVSPAQWIFDEIHRMAADAAEKGKA